MCVIDDVSSHTTCKKRAGCLILAVLFPARLSLADEGLTSWWQMRVEKEREDVLVCVHVCMRQTCMRVLVDGVPLHLEARQSPVVTNVGHLVLEGDGLKSARPWLSLQIFVECKHHTQHLFVSLETTCNPANRQPRSCCLQKIVNGPTPAMRKRRQVLGTRKG